MLPLSLLVWTKSKKYSTPYFLTKNTELDYNSHLFLQTLVKKIVFVYQVCIFYIMKRRKSLLLKLGWFIEYVIDKK